MSVKLGDCTEYCKHCVQSVKTSTYTATEKLMNIDGVVEWAKEAKNYRSTIFYLGPS